MIKSIIFPLLKYFLALKKKTVGYAILTYHNISDVSDLILPDPMTVDYASFKQQIDYISDKFSVISISEIVERVTSKTKADKLYVGITFDDGILNQYKLAAPLLENYGLPATFFITTNYADQIEIPFLEKCKYWVQVSNKKVELEYNDKYHGLYDLSNKIEKNNFYKKMLTILSNYSNEGEKFVEYLHSIFFDIKIPRIYMTWEEIRNLNQTSNFTIGAHSVTHAKLKNVQNVLETEVVKSKDILENKMNVTCNYFAYPFGMPSDVNNYLFSLMESSGYDAAFTSIMGLNKKYDSNYQLERIAPIGNENISQFASRLYWADEIGDYQKVINFLSSKWKNQ